MNSLIGRTNVTVNDALPPSINVVYSSANSIRLACIGTCNMLVIKPTLTLVPIDSKLWVVNNIFTCPKEGTWMIWVNWGHQGRATAQVQAFFYNLFYKINTNANVLLGDFYMSARCAHTVVSLKKGDKVSFPAMQYVSTFIGSYCFEYVGL